MRSEVPHARFTGPMLSNRVSKIKINNCEIKLWCVHYVRKEPDFFSLAVCNEVDEVSESFLTGEIPLPGVRTEKSI